MGLKYRYLLGTHILEVNESFLIIENNPRFMGNKNINCSSHLLLCETSVIRHWIRDDLEILFGYLHHCSLMALFLLLCRHRRS